MSMLGGKGVARIGTGLLCVGLGWSPALAQAPAPTEREIVFPSGSVALRGTLMMPSTGGPFPVVIFLHGSGPATRDGARSYAEEFARVGVASLFFDKRGSGASGGSWQMASLDDLASDALAAVEYARAEAMIDEGRIGFWGVSQAGWVAPLAASRSDHVSFMILNSGGGASPRESELFSWRGEFERAGLTVAETADANAVLDAYFGYLATGLDRAGVEARLDSVRQGRLGPLAEALDGVMPSDENRGNWSWVATHDPMPYLEGIDVPVLLMFGDRDTDHPTELSVARWREGLSRAGNEDATIMIFPGAGHGIRLREGYVGQGSAPFAPGYLEVQIGWLLRNVVASNP